MRRDKISGLTAAAILLFNGAAAHGADPVLSCQSTKLKVAGKYGHCRLLAEAKGAKAGEEPDYSRCDAKFAGKWTAAEEKAGPLVCPSEGEVLVVQDLVTRHADAIADILAGGPVDDHDCPATGQTISFGTGDDGDVRPGAALAYVDNGDGTVTDSNTGLVWEKKVALDAGFSDCTAETGTCANPHDANNLYAWTSTVSGYDGPVVTIFLEQLNDRCDQDASIPCDSDADCVVPGGACGFAGHRDWRLPTRNELAALMDAGTTQPTIDAAFDGAGCGPACTDVTDPSCSCTRNTWHATSTTLADEPEFVWVGEFEFGSIDAYSKAQAHLARAVRGGS